MRNKGKSVMTAEKSEKKQRGKPFEKGTSGNPNGRPKGSKSIKTKLVEEKLAALDYDPIRAMVELAKDDETPVAVKAKLASELASFVFPKRKAVEHSGNIGKRDLKEYSDAELQAMLDEDGDRSGDS